MLRKVIVRTRKSISTNNTKAPRSQSERGDRKVNVGVHFVQEKQMLDIQENNNRNTYGSPHEDPREPETKSPPSAVILKLQQQIKQMQSSETTK